MLREFIRFWTPAEKFRQLNLLDQEAPSYSLTREASAKRVHYCVFVVCLCLLALNYARGYDVFVDLSHGVASILGLPGDYFTAAINASAYSELAQLAWWSASHVLCYVLLPWLFIALVLKESFSRFGWRWNNTHRHWRGYLFLVVPIMVMVYFASQRSDFIRHYPFYSLTRRSIFDLVTWEICYLIQFVCLEFFFRGFILQALRPAIGANAIWLMVPPYLMVHFSKPWLEASGAIFFGLFLGILALRSRSIWGGFFVHCGVALSMDFASLYQQGALPRNFWPQ